MEHTTILCDGCGVEITWAALVRRPPHSTHLFYYCCDDCLQDLECACAERLELEDQHRISSEVPAAWPP